MLTDQPIDPESPTTPEVTTGMRPILRIILKAALLFILLNALFAACRPLDKLGEISFYNLLVPGRARLSYGEVPAEDFNLTLNNLPAMFAAHEWDRPRRENEYRVLLIGDSATWGWFLENEDTLAGQLNALDLVADDGREVVVYNLGYPVMSLTKDLMILDAALERADPDLILWPVTMQSFARAKQLEHPLLHENAWRVRELIDRFELALDPADERFVDRNFVQETISGRRRDLADLIRHQAWGLAWAATGQDQAVPDMLPLRKSDFEDDASWLDIESPRTLSEDDLTFDVLRAGLKRAGDVPVVIVNEPMFISDGANSDVRYNAFYPRWAYDRFRDMLGGAAEAEGWTYLDFWNAIPAGEFTDTPVHLTPEGSLSFAKLLASTLFNQDE